MKYRNFISILSFICIFPSLLFSQGFLQKHKYDNSLEQKSTAGTEASKWFDVVYYRLDLKVATVPIYLSGKVTISGTCRTDSASRLTLDLADKMRIDSVAVDGWRCFFTQNRSSFVITLPRLYILAESISIDVYYGGIPSATGFGSFVFDNHNGIPWVYTLSEPYGAKDWWPCKDDPADKADSADIIITCNSNLIAGSQGILASVIQNVDGTAAYHWKERYPIASYLISLAITNYAQFSNWFRYSDTDSMEVLNFVLPEHYNSAIQSLPRVIDMLAIFSDLFGLYPFIKEKYGHAEFGWTGAMEHQTMTSTSTFDENVISHELAHQWFGNMITCRTWSDLWLNEGFAQYSTALYLERQYGIGEYWNYMNNQIDNAETARGELGNPDTTSVRNLFDSRLVYSKGAAVLHMLRHVLGDSVFFLAIREYANDPDLKYGTAATRDLQSVCERVSGKNLSYFFSQWVYGEGYPTYLFSWTWNASGDSSGVVLNIGQITGRDNPEYFTMPVDIRITAAGRDTTITIFNDSQHQQFVVDFNAKPDNVVLDPERWIMKYVIPGNETLPTAFMLEQNYPNPFNSMTNIIYRLQRQANVRLTVYDMLGREIETVVNARQTPGIYEYRWIPRSLASGIYICRLKAGSEYLQRKMVILK
ncbi:MAG: T9SS type A sorting domain-containing protein [Bacteroidetes bacterium]|nr:T9SS type A sorting domain-containing protein [Bacteroidota bacterium]